MENKIKDLDDMIFQNKNKAYGAYSNRKNYKKYLTLSVLLACLLFLSCVSAPLIANYLSGFADFGDGKITIKDTLANVTLDKQVIELPKPKEIKPVHKAFFVPKVVDESDVDNDLSVDLDDIKNLRVNDSLDRGQIEITEPDGTEIIEPDPIPTYLIVQEMPKFPGEDAGMVKYLKANVVYPELAKNVGITGIVFVTFVVDENGNVVEPRVERGIGGGCDEEALRVIDGMPRWTPGRQGGIPVRVQFTLPINFILK